MLSSFEIVAFTTIVALLLFLSITLRKVAYHIEWMSGEMSGMSARLAFIERRAMSANIRLHEVVRQMMSLISSYDPQADATWLSRQWGDLCSEYCEALSRRGSNNFAANMTHVRYAAHLAFKRY